MLKHGLDSELLFVESIFINTCFELSRNYLKALQRVYTCKGQCSNALNDYILGHRGMYYNRATIIPTMVIQISSNALLIETKFLSCKMLQLIQITAMPMI